MSVLVKKQLNQFCSIRKKVKSAMFSLFYPALICALTFTFWALDKQEIGAVICCLFGIISLLLCDDITPSLPAFFSLAMAFRNATKISDSALVIVFLCLLMGALVANLIIYPIKKVKFDFALFSMAILTLVTLLGGIFSPYFNEFSSGLSLIATGCFAPLIVHFLVSNRAKDQKESDSTLYFCYSFLFAIITSCMQMLHAYVINDLVKADTFAVPGGFCWANTNHIANFILIAVPICFYLMCRENNIIPVLIMTVLFYACSFFTNSDGGLGTLLIFTPALILKTLLELNGRNRKVFVWFLAVLFLSLAVLVVYSLIYRQGEMAKFFEKLINDSNRSSIFNKAWQLFLESPLLGVGMGHAFNQAGVRLHGFLHSTFFQALASSGILGVLAFVLLYYARFKSLKDKGNKFCSFIGIATVMFLSYGLIENSEVNIVVVYYTAVFSIAITQTEKAENFISLPIRKNFDLFS